MAPLKRIPGCSSSTPTARRAAGARSRLGSAKTSRDGVTPRAIADYERLSATPALRRQAAAGVVGLAYFHIPLYEYVAGLRITM